MRRQNASPTPEPPAHLSPSDGTIDLTYPIGFSWTEQSGDVGYRIQVDADPYFGNPVYDRTLGATTVFEVTAYLDEGETYYWRVIGFIETSSGQVELESEIFCFRIAQFDQIAGGQEQYEFILRNFLGSDYDKIFGEGGQLQGYRPKKMVFNGQEITLPDILTRLQKLNERYSGYRIEN